MANTEVTVFSESDLNITPELNISKLNICDINISLENIQSLKFINSIEVNRCTISDLSCFNGFNCVKIRNCNIINSSIHNVNDLTFVSCRNLNIKIKNVKDLKICYCKIESIEVLDCGEIDIIDTIIDKLDCIEAEKLKIMEMSHLKSINVSDKTVHCVIVDCFRLSYLTGGFNLTHLTLDKTNIMDLPMMPNLLELSLDESLVHDGSIPSIINVNHLYIFGNDCCISEFEKLEHLITLSLYKYNNKHIKLPESLKSFTMENSYVETVMVYDKIGELYINGCKLLKKVELVSCN